MNGLRQIKQTLDQAFIISYSNYSIECVKKASFLGVILDS